MIDPHLLQLAFRARINQWKSKSFKQKNKLKKNKIYLQIFYNSLNRELKM